MSSNTIRRILCKKTESNEKERIRSPHINYLRLIKKNKSSVFGITKFRITFTTNIQTNLIKTERMKRQKGIWQILSKEMTKI